MVLFIKPYQHQITLKSISIAVVYSASRISIGDRDANELGEETGWLLIEKTTDVEGEQESAVNVKAWICWGLDDHSLEELVE